MPQAEDPTPLEAKGADFYAASLINGKPPRNRATKAEMADRETELLKIVAEGQPMSVRQVFYQATVRGLIEKTESGYGKVQRMLAELRLAERLPWGWIADHTRWQRKPATFDSLEHAIESTEAHYRRSLWASVDAYVEVWIEKDALTGVVYPITSKYDVPLMSARGYSSLTFLHTAAAFMSEVKKPCYVYHLGDHDPSGVNAGEKIEETLRKLSADGTVIHFERLAVNPEQIEEWSLPGRPTKQTDTRAKKFGHAESVELDAIHPDKLREIVEQAILKHISPHEIEVIKVAEESERETLKLFRGLYAQVQQPKEEVKK